MVLDRAVLRRHLHPLGPLPLQHGPLPHHPADRLRSLPALSRRHLAPHRLSPRRALVLLERRNPRRVQRRQRAGRRLRQRRWRRAQLDRCAGGDAHGRRGGAAQQRRQPRSERVDGRGPRRAAGLAGVWVHHAGIRQVGEPRGGVLCQRLCRVAGGERGGAGECNGVSGPGAELEESLGCECYFAGFHGLCDAEDCGGVYDRAGSASVRWVLLG